MKAGVSKKVARLSFADERGVAIYEFALILPIVCLFAFMGLEFSRALRYSQLASSLSREAASVVYRDCTNRSVPDTMSCLTAAQQSLQLFGSKLIPGSQLVLSVYDWDSTSGPVRVRRLGIGPVTAATGYPGVHQTKYSVTGGTMITGIQGTLVGSGIAGDISSQLLEKHRVIVISEAFIPYSSLSGNILARIGFNPSVFYDVTIV